MSIECGIPHPVQGCSSKELLSASTKIVWSPLFESSPKNNRRGNSSGFRILSSGSKDHTVLSDGELPAGWRTAEQQQQSLLAGKIFRASLPGASTNPGGPAPSSSDDELGKQWRTPKSAKSRSSVDSQFNKEFGEENLCGTAVSCNVSGDIQKRVFNETSSHENIALRLEVFSNNQNSIPSSGCSKSPVLMKEKEGIGRGKLYDSRTDVDTGALITKTEESKSISKRPSIDYNKESKSRWSWEECNEVEGGSHRRNQKDCLSEYCQDTCVPGNNGSVSSGSLTSISRQRTVTQMSTRSLDESELYELQKGPHSEKNSASSSGREEKFIRKWKKSSLVDRATSRDGKRRTQMTKAFEDTGHTSIDSDCCLNGTGLDRNRFSNREVGPDTSGYSSCGTCQVFLRQGELQPHSQDKTTRWHSSSGHVQSTSKPGVPCSSTDTNGMHKGVLMDELDMRGGVLNCRLESKPLSEAPFPNVRDNLIQGSDSAASSRTDTKVMLKKSPPDIRGGKDIGRTTPGSSRVTSDKDKEEKAISHGRRKKSSRKKRSQSPAAAVACAASMIGDTVEAVRRVREEAAALAFKLAELHAHDAKALRSAAVVMRHHVDTLHNEVQCFDSSWTYKQTIDYPWQSFIREFIVAVGVLSGAFSVQTCINSFRRALGVFQHQATGSEKVVVAVLVLSVGARFGTGVWHGLGNVKSSRKAWDSKLREQLRQILERTSLMSALAHSDPTTCQSMPSSEPEDSDTSAWCHGSR